MRESSSTAVRVWVRAWVVDSAAVDTPVMVSAISPMPFAAACTDRDISLVVAVSPTMRRSAWPDGHALLVRVTVDATDQ